MGLESIEDMAKAGHDQAETGAHFERCMPHLPPHPLLSSSAAERGNEPGLGLSGDVRQRVECPVREAVVKELVEVAVERAPGVERGFGGVV